MAAETSMATKAKAKVKEKAAADKWRRIRPGRWSLLLLLVGLMVGSAAWGVQKLQDPELLPLKIVRIDGGFQRLKREDVQRVLAPHIQTGFFAIDVAAIRAATEELPWVDEVSVRLVWPDTLQLSVTEQVPLARWQQDRMLNLRGEVFQPPLAEIPQGLPVFVGPDGSESEVLSRFQELNERLAPLGLAVKKIGLDARRAWTLKMDDGLIVRLGKKDVEMRMARFFRVYPLLQRKQLQLKEVDLRYTNGFSIRKDSERGEVAAPKVGMGSGITMSCKRGLV
jgi:cell division protein FtsQ